MNDSGVDVSADDVPTRFVEELNTTAAQNSRNQPSMGGALFNPDYSDYQRTNQSNESASVESGALNFSDDDDDAHRLELVAQWMHHDPMPDVGYGMN